MSLQRPVRRTGRQYRLVVRRTPSSRFTRQYARVDDDRRDLDPLVDSTDDGLAPSASPIRATTTTTLLAVLAIALLGLISWNVVQQTKLMRQNTCINRAYLDLPAQRTEGWRSRVAEHCGVERVQVDLHDP